MEMFVKSIDSEDAKIKYTIGIDESGEPKIYKLAILERVKFQTNAHKSAVTIHALPDDSGKYNYYSLSHNRGPIIGTANSIVGAIRGAGVSDHLNDIICECMEQSKDFLTWTVEETDILNLFNEFGKLNSKGELCG